MSLETAEFVDTQFYIPLDDLHKSITRAHFRKMKSGKYLWIPQYDNKHAPRVRAVVDLGDRVRMEQGRGAGVKGSVCGFSNQTGKLRIKGDDGNKYTVALHQVKVFSAKHIDRARLLREGGQLPDPPKPPAPKRKAVQHGKKAFEARNYRGLGEDYIRYVGGELTGQYTYADGTPVGDEDAERIRKIGIPPAWRNVQIAKDPNHKLQAVGWDEAGRRQPKYTQEFRESQDAQKFLRVKGFAKDIKKLRTALAKDVDSKDRRRKEAARVLYIIEQTGLRLGMHPNPNKPIVAKKQAYGASSMLVKHISFPSKDTVKMSFTGKSGKAYESTEDDPTLVRILREQVAGKKPDEHLFSPRSPGYARNYMKEFGEEYKPKDLRTYRGTFIAQIAVEDYLEKNPVPATKAETKKVIKEILLKVSKVLNNTPGMAKKAYIAPIVFEPFKEVHGENVV